MACYMYHQSLTCNIVDVATAMDVTYYHVVIQIGEVKWRIVKRYREFDDLHQKLLSHGIPRDLLPPKKFIRNKEPAFIEKRRASLEIYIQNVCQFFQQLLPKELAEFLLLHDYEVSFISRQMAANLFQDGENLLKKKLIVTFTRLQIHAISVRSKLALPPMDSGNTNEDFSNVLDFCSQLHLVCIQGGNFKVGLSNIIPNLLPIDLTAFKSLKMLEMRKSNLTNITGLDNARQTVDLLVIKECFAKSVSEILLCDTVHHDDGKPWVVLKTADFSGNEIEDIDASVRFMPKVESIDLSRNKLTSVSNHLSTLPQLRILNLSCNCIKVLNQLHLALGNIVTLNLSQNELKTLDGIGKLYSLCSLDASCNKIEEVTSVETIFALPCLENINLTGNPVASTIDYRVKVLQQFGKRVSEICLDNERASQKEMDTVAVLQALQTARLEKLKHS